MIKYLSAFTMILAKVFFRLFYRCEVKWVNQQKADPWRDVRLYVFLNHTSLYEPLFLLSIPNSFILENAPKMLAPGADVTLMRPIVGKIFAILFPGMVPITRKRDESWNQFLGMIKPDSFVAIAPEGRMKRASGLDKEGKPMSVMGGIADILSVLKSGNMLIAYSGGLHHVQIPGQKVPNIFKTIKINYEVLKIEQFISHCRSKKGPFKLTVTAELEERMRQFIP